MNAKKIVTAGLALVMVAGISVAGTLAYLTSDGGEVKNTFTVGSVTIDLTEGEYENGVYTEAVRVDGEQSYGKVTPNVKYDKDPVVHVKTDSEDCYVFVKVTNGISAYELGDTDDYDPIEKQIVTNHTWTKLTGVDGVNDVYYKYVDVSEMTGTSLRGEDKENYKDLTVFDEFCLDGEKVTSNTELAPIIVKAAAVQYAGFESNVAGAYAEVSGFLK